MSSDRNKKCGEVAERERERYSQQKRLRELRAEKIHPNETKRTAFTDTLSRCACAFMSVWICTQNVRMIYFHIWFVCASSSNVIHIKWNFLCSFNIQRASLILIAVVICAICSATMKSFTVFQVYLFLFEIFFLCVCLSLSLSFSLLSLQFSILMHLSHIFYSTLELQNERQIFGKTKYGYFPIYSRLYSYQS